MNKVFAGIAIVILVGIGVYAKGMKTKNSPLSSSPSPVTRSIDSAYVDSLKQGGSSYSDPNGVYVFLYPNEYKLDTQNNGQVVRIYKTGPTQKGQTEIYDGVIMTFETQNKNGKSLEDWTEEYIKSMVNDQTIELVNGKEKTKVNGYDAYSFRIRGLGEHDYLVMEKDKNSELVTIVVSNVSDPGNLGFQNEVNATLNTIELQK